MKGLFSHFFRAFLILSLSILSILSIGVLAPVEVQAANFGGITDNGTAAFMGIGTNPHTIRPLYLLGNVCLFERQQNSAGFILHRSGGDVTGYNRWVFGADEPTGFVIKSYPWDGATAVEQLVITKDDPATPANESRVGIGTTSPTLKLDVRSTTGAAISGTTTYSGELPGGDIGVLGVGGNGVKGIGGTGVVGEGGSTGVYGYSITGGTGIFAYSDGGIGLWAMSGNNTAVMGLSVSGVGVIAQSYYANIIEAWDYSDEPIVGRNLRFKVTNAGDVYADGTFNPGGADFAEILPAVGGLEPGDVLVIGDDGNLTRSKNAYSTAVAGVYSTKPGFVGGAGDGEDLTGKVPLAIVGVVPVKVSVENGSIKPGDLLCTSNTPGHAMKATEPKLGTVICKALEGLKSGIGTIKVLVTLQ